MKKNIYLLSFSLFFSLIITSCGSFSSSIEIEKPENADKLKETIINDLGDVKPYFIELYKGHNAGLFSNKMERINAEVIEGDKMFYYGNNSFGNIVTSNGKAMPITNRSAPGREPLNLEEIDFSKVSTYLNDAISQVPDGYTYEGIGYYRIERHRHKGYVLHDFELELTKNDDLNTGGQVDYYEFEFYTDKDGKLINRN